MCHIYYVPYKFQIVTTYPIHHRRTMDQFETDYLHKKNVQNSFPYGHDYLQLIKEIL